MKWWCYQPKVPFQAVDQAGCYEDFERIMKDSMKEIKKKLDIVAIGSYLFGCIVRIRK